MIRLSGPHFSGKTTIAEYLRDWLDFRAVTYSRPGIVAQSFYDCRPSEIKEKDRDTFQIVAAMEQLSAEVRHEQWEWNVVIDRTLIDFAAYTTNPTIKEAIILQASYEYRADTNPVFLVEPLSDLQIEDDGKRFLTDPSEMWDNFIQLYESSGIPYVIVKRDTLENRVKFILDTIGYDLDEQ